MAPETALAVCRFVHDTSAMLLWGGFACLAVLVPRDLAGAVAGRMRTFRIVTLCAAVATTIAALPIEVARIGDGWSAVGDPATVGAVLFETSVGHAWWAQAGAAALLAATLPLSTRPAVTAAAAGSMVAMLASTGHATMQEQWSGVAHRLNDAVHVLAAGAWFGALVPLVLILSALADPLRRGVAGLALRRFSTIGHGVVALVIATGAVNTWLTVGRLPADLTSAYQALLDVKIALVLAMTGIAILNRYRFVPRMRQDRLGAIRAIRRGTIMEIGLGAMAIGCVGVFGLLDPR